MRVLISSLSGLWLILISCELPTAEPAPGLNQVTIQNFAERLLQGDTLQFSSIIAGEKLNSLTLEYFWNFGDSNTSMEVTPQHQYMLPGDYLISLNVNDNVGNYHADSIQVTIVPSLRLLNSYDLDIDEPSGLCLSADGASLWTVSDITGSRIYRISFTGELLQTVDYFGHDLEGISTGADNSLWIVEEGRGRLTRIDTSASILDSVFVAGALDGAGGLEGVAYAHEGEAVFLAKERDPSVLITLDSNLERSAYQRIGFAADLSGLSYVSDSEALFAVSHEDAMVYELDLNGNLGSYYAVDLLQAEGIAVDLDNERYYLVDDARNKLYHYTIWESY